MEMTPEQQEKLRELQTIQNQLQMISMQRQQSKIQMDEMQDSLIKLENVTGKIYLFSGTLFLESTKDNAKKDIEEKIEIIKVRDTAIAKQEERIKKRSEELQNELMGQKDAGAG